MPWVPMPRGLKEATVTSITHDDDRAEHPATWPGMTIAALTLPITVAAMALR